MDGELTTRIRQGRIPRSIGCPSPGSVQPNGKTLAREELRDTALDLQLRQRDSAAVAHGQFPTERERSSTNKRTI